jgi:hypothetical protein
MHELQTRPLFHISMTLHPAQALGKTPLGTRRIIPVSGGRFEGTRLRGEVLPHAGSDWLLERADGTFQQDVRVTLKTDDGAIVGMTYRGVRRASPDVAARLARGETVPAAEYYLRTAPFFETASEDYAWLNGIVAIAAGGRIAGGVAYDVFEIL